MEEFTAYKKALAFPCEYRFRYSLCLLEITFAARFSISASSTVA
jgi:hypothetical protein